MRIPFFYLAAASTTLLQATAQTFDLTPTWDSSNHARVFIGGGGNTSWINFDDGTSSNPSRQQWQWLDFSAEVEGIPTEFDIVSATLTWHGEENSTASNNAVTWSVFAAEGPDRSREAVIVAGGGGRNGGDVPAYYASRTPYGSVTTGQIASSDVDTPVSWDVTGLVSAWHEGELTENVGQLIILNDRNRFFGPPGGNGHGGIFEWINWDNGGPTLTVVANIDQVAPEAIVATPSTVVADTPQGTQISFLDAIDVNAADTHTFTLVAGDGDSDNSRFSINGAGNLVLASAAGTAGTTYTIRLRATDNSALSLEQTIQISVVQHPLRISEFLTQNDSGLEDENNETSDWIELQNTTAEPVSLLGWSLTDDPLMPRHWTLPEVTIPAAGYLVVFASRKARNPTDGSPIHTNFALSQSGEYLALFPPDSSTVPASVFAPEYPNQFANVSYSDAGYYATPTPGAANSTVFDGQVADTTFSSDRGFYESPFSVTLSTATEGATLIYTTDGSAPTATNGISSAGINSVTIPISTTTVLRATAVKDGLIGTNIDTQTYIFANDLLSQGRPSGHPNSVDFQMDPEVVNDPRYATELPGSFLSVPSISIVMDFDDLFGSDGIYTNPTQQGQAWERAGSIEWIDQAAAETFQIDSAVELQGAGSRTQSPKRNFRLTFKRPFGPPNLEFKLFEDSGVDRFDSLVLRNATHDSWTVSQDTWRANARYVNDSWGGQTQKLMGHLSPNRRWVHLYLNGLYWGIYTLTERPDADFLASHLGGDEDDYDALNANRVRDGDRIAWDSARQIARGDGANGSIATRAAYEELEGLLDIDGLIDYFLYNLYMVNIDWPGKNYWVGRKREPGAGFIFLNWDAETGFFESWIHARNPRNLNALDFDLINSPAVLANTHGAGFFYRELGANAEFRLRFADRLHKHANNGGLLSPENARTRYRALLDEIEPLLVPESARWGDSQQARNPLTPDDEWADLTAETDWLFTDFFPQRSDNLIADIRAEGTYPDTDPPLFSAHGGTVPSGFDLTITNPNTSGTIYFTTDGQDPREPWTSAATGNSYTAPIDLTSSVVVKARVLRGGEWSALTEASFAVGVAATAENLAITEIHYHPSPPTTDETALGFDDQDDFEFIELTNISASDDVTLTGVRFVAGVEFAFAGDVTLAPGERILVVKNLAAVRQRHPDIPVSVFAGEFSSSAGIVDDEQLSNAGERLTLLGATDNVIADFTYSDDLPWPTSADGDGYSLVLRQLDGDPTQPTSWRSSVTINGNPNTSDTVPFSGGSLLAYVTTDPISQLRLTGSGKVEITYFSNLASDSASFTLMSSTDLITWIPVGTTFEIDRRENLGDGSVAVALQSVDPVSDERTFYCLKVSIP